MFQALVGDGVALADVQHLEAAQRLGYVRYAVVGYLARAQRQGVQAAQAVRHVQQRLVADLVAERYVQAAQLGAALGQVTDADVGHVVARAQVQLVQRAHARHVVQPRVGDVHAEAQVEAAQRAQALGHVLEALVGDVLAVLQAEELELRVAVGGVLASAADVRQAHVGQVPARPQVEVFEFLQLARYVRETLVGYVRAALDLEPREPAQRVRDADQSAVGQLLAQRQVQLGDVRVVFEEHLVQVLVLDVVTAAHVQRHQVGYVLHDLAQTLVPGHGQHLDALDAALLEALVHRV